MYSRSGAPQWPWAVTCSAQVIGSGLTVWIDKPRLYGLVGVGLVELLAGDLGRRRLVHAPDLVVEAAGGLRRALHHQVPADLVVVVAQPVGIARVAESSSSRGVSIE